MLSTGTSVFRFALGVAAIMTAASDLHAQNPSSSARVSDPSWARAISATSSSLEMQGRSEHLLAFDRARGRAVLFGGAHSSGGGDFVGSNDTWEWDAVSGWVEQTPTDRPPRRVFGAMAYDEARGQIVLFGGRSGAGSAPKDDTWTWDGTNWHERSPPTKPPGMMDPALACDLARSRCTLFGASGPSLPDGGTRGHTWEWDGTTWTERTPAASPSGRGRGAMAYDRKRGKIVLFGGGAGGHISNDTWEWDGATWTELSPATPPAPRGGHVLGYHEAIGKVFLFGGCAKFWEFQGLVLCEQYPLSDMWSWDGDEWTQVFPAVTPRPRFKMGMTYDPIRQRLIMIGGDIAVVDAGTPGVGPDGGFDPRGGDTWTWVYGDAVDSDGGVVDGDGPGYVDGSEAQDVGGPGNDDASVGDATSADITDVSTPTDQGTGNESRDAACSCKYVGAKTDGPSFSAIAMLFLMIERRCYVVARRRRRSALI
jgi:hypothetical protein